MIDDITYDIHPEIAQAMPSEPLVQEQVTEQQEAVAPAPVTVRPEQKPETIEEINWRAAREKERRLQQERDEALRIAQELQQKYASSSAKATADKQPTEEQDDLGIGNDDIVEGKHLSKVQRELRKIKEELNAYKQQSTQYTAETRLKAQYPDFDKIVNKENIETLQYAYPELYNTLSASTDLYNTGVAAYTLIKKFNIDQAKQPDMDLATKNIAKPKPTNSISPQQGDNPLTRANAFANGLTEDVKKQMFKEMQEARKGY